MTRWKHVPGDKAYCYTTNIWDPIYYSTETIRAMVYTLWKFQQLGNKWLNKYSPHERKVMIETLSHEDRKLLGYEKIRFMLLDALGITHYSEKEIENQLHDLTSNLHQDLKKRAQSRWEKIHEMTLSILKKCGFSEKTPLNDLSEMFLNRPSISWKEALRGYETRTWKTWHAPLF